MVKVRFFNSEEDYIEAYRELLYGSIKSSVDLIIEMIVLSMGLILYGIVGFSFVYLILIIGSMVAIIIRILGYFILPKIRYRREPKYKEEYLLEFDNEGINFKTKSLDSKVEWSFYNKVIETRKKYILVYSKVDFSIIPKKAFLTEKDEKEFNTLIDKSIEKKVKRI